MKKHMAKLLGRIDEHGKAGEVVQMHHMFKACTIDVINIYAFGDSFHFLDQLDYGSPYFDATEKFFGLTHIFGHFTWIADLVQSLPLSLVALCVPSLRQLWEKQNVLCPQTEISNQGEVKC